jgi:hypothetical protein
MPIACSFMVSSWYATILLFVLCLSRLTYVLLYVMSCSNWSCPCTFFPTISWSHDEYEEVMWNICQINRPKIQKNLMETERKKRTHTHTHTHRKGSADKRCYIYGVWSVKFCVCSICLLSKLHGFTCMHLSAATLMKSLLPHFAPNFLV